MALAFLAAGLAPSGCASSAGGAPTPPRLVTTHHGCDLAAPRPTARFDGTAHEDVVLVDHSRMTPADPRRGLPAEPDRSLPVVIEYPVSGVNHPERTTAGDSPPARGPFPLVVVAHGVSSSGSVMATLALPWVRAGYVVAAPTLPRSSGPGGDDADLPQQPRDIRFLVSALERYFSEPAALLHGHVEARCLAVVGHSGGAATALSVGYESGVADPRIGAVVSLSGIAAPLAGGPYSRPPPTPLLLIHGSEDTAVPIAFSRQAFARLRVPRIFVTLHGADHLSIFVPPASVVLNEAVIDFLDATLKSRAGAIATLRTQVRGSPDATMESSAGAR